MTVPVESAPEPFYTGSNGRSLSPEQRAEIERRTLVLLLNGATFQEIRDAVGITAPTIASIRRDAGLPPSGNQGGGPARTIDEALEAAIEPYGDGHARWTGPMAGRMPTLHAEGQRFNGRRLLFSRHHGRQPDGHVRADCGESACVAGAHATDTLMRNSIPQEKPVTIRALTNLLDEIDREGGPQAARDNRLHLSSQEPTMATAPQPLPSVPALATVPSATGPHAEASADSSRRPSETLQLGRLLKWAEEHHDEDVQATAARTRAALTGLRNRYDADQELTSLTQERENLQRRLAEIQARQDELAPPKPKKRTDPNAAAARAWARENNVGCPGTGRVPKAVMDAWREATGGAA
ncbi:hypothetical protein ACIPSJ_01675 [Streptomyces sp. NPDC090088]|uniref:hypothetical protein n=1 Tax=Streptomyces sp. NPDC090088 TaxID=3365944 RepID=UPI0038210BB5